ncbi:MAG: sigma-70 family RNA polymerase sigma factor [Verrucomicrobia bacterium]|nr:sigma-70 family RNA polymerase sigma factor [Verrucomicrobiota bacterium]
MTEHLFRVEAGKLVSVLTGIFGIDHLQLAEDVVQEALVRAFRTWPYYGIPENPAAWITQTAKNLAYDVLRREKLFREKQTEIVVSVEQRSSNSAVNDSVLFDSEIKDDCLRLIFACCHPMLAPESQTALALRTLCGFSPAEIAKAFLTTEAAISKRLTRTRQKIRELHIPFEIPAGEEFTARLNGVLQTLYLLFNEGYKASSGENLVREDLCYEAIRLATLLAEHPAANLPRTHALVALMFLNAARLPARVDLEGNILRLKEQERSKWRRPMIERGIIHLGQASKGHELSEYHLQAGIAACHCMAESFESTDWPRILALYDQWVQMNPSPVIALNRAVAVATVRGPAAGIEAIKAIRHRGELKSYYLFYAVLGEFEAQLHHFEAASAHFRKALELTEVKTEQIFLSKRVRSLRP